jgi:hypothetical protein
MLPGNEEQVIKLLHHQGEGFSECGFCSFRETAGHNTRKFPDCFPGGKQMTRIEESIQIRYPVEKVFAITTDTSQWSTCHSAIPEAEQTSSRPV